MRAVALILWAALLLPFSAQATPAADEVRAQRLFTEVRCVACQGQDIGDSDAAIAGDMRRDIRQQIAQGHSDTEIRKSLYAHYGDYVLFRPRLSASNLILWGLPPLIILAGVGWMFWRGRKSSESRSYALSPEEEEKLRKLVKSE